MTDVDFENGGDFATDPLILGARPADILAGAPVALGSGSLQFDFINTAPGAPIPDILSAVFGELEVPGFELLRIKIAASGDGILYEIPLHEVPWTEGDRGKMSLSSNEIFFNHPSPNSKLVKNIGAVGADLRVVKIGN